MSNWISVTDISDIPKNKYVLFTVKVKYEHEDSCFDCVLPGYRQDVNVHDARIVVEQGVGNMPDIEMSYEATSEGLGACTIKILAYMNYPKPYRPIGRILTKAEVDEIATNIVRCYLRYRCDAVDLREYTNVRVVKDISKKIC